MRRVVLGEIRFNPGCPLCMHVLGFDRILVVGYPVSGRRKLDIRFPAVYPVSIRYPAIYPVSLIRYSPVTEYPVQPY